MKNDKKRIVLCGSMSSFGEMTEIAEELSEFGIPTVLPDTEGPEIGLLSYEEFLRWKLNASKRHLRRIRDNGKTFGILVVNQDKNDIKGYIGANTFAEIAVAFSHYINIYLLYDAPSLYREELEAWNAMCLGGNLSRLLSDYSDGPQSRQRSPQMELFPRGFLDDWC